MKKFYFALAALALFSTLDASAFTAAQIAGKYDAKGMDFSMNYACFMGSTAENLGSVDWTMEISVIDGNNVKLTQFIKEKINSDKLPDNKFDMEGVFDPATNTITIAAKDFSYPYPGFSFLTMTKTIAKYDGVTELAEVSPIEEYESFTATFDSSMNLTISPWAIYDTSSKLVCCIPDYNDGAVKGTYFTHNGPIDIEGPTGIETVGTDTDANAPVEYFNLQGVKVANPENGGLYIRRQGNKVEKVIIR